MRRTGYATWFMLLRRGAVSKGINEAFVQYHVNGNSLLSKNLESVRQVWEIQTQNENVNKILSLYNVISF